MPDPTIDDLLRNYSPEVRTLALRTCDLVRTVLPDATEKVHLGWKNITFGTGPKMGDMIFSVGPLKERVNIHLAGADLPDPTGLLEGKGKMGRHVKITDSRILEDAALKDLLLTAVAAHDKPSAERVRKAGPPLEGHRAYGSKTIAVPVEQLYRAWTDDRLRGRWLGSVDLTIRGTTTNKSLRARGKGDTPVDVRFTSKGEDKSQVAIDHRGMKTEADAARLKSEWKLALARMKEVLEG